MIPRHNLVLALLATVTIGQVSAAALTPRAGAGQQCGPSFGKCDTGLCCSNQGWCGTTDHYCNVNEGLCQKEYGTCWATSSSSPGTAGEGQQCGDSVGGTKCGAGLCCSKKGYCGKTDRYCNPIRCDAQFGVCWPTTGSGTQCYIDQTTGWGTVCEPGLCCSNKGWCGNTIRYCAADLCNGQLTDGSCWTTLSDGSSAKYLFVFGDSYSAVHFSVGGTAPSVSNPIGNPNFPGQTSTSGHNNWVTYLTASYNHSLILTYDLAVDGAATLTDTGSGYGTVVDQINRFDSNLTPAPSGAPWTGSNSLFAIWIGINDMDTYGSLSTSARASFFSQYFNKVQDLYDGGARRFLFLTIPPVERSPWAQVKAVSSPATLNSNMMDFNYRLADAVSKFQTAHSGVTAAVFDAHGFFNKILDNYQSYGFTDIDNPCAGCADHFWNSNLHPTYSVHKLLAQEIASSAAFSTL